MRVGESNRLGASSCIVHHIAPKLVPLQPALLGLVPHMATISSSDGSAAISKMPEGSTSSTPPATAMSSCRRKKSEGASFVQDIRDHFDEFVHASMDEHRACFKNTLNKMFKSSKKTANESELPSAPVESVLPLSSTTSS